MSQQLPTLCGLGLEGPLAEEDVLSLSEGDGVQVLVERVGFSSYVHSDVAKVVPEGLFHLHADRIG
jgi:hypothetical protein